METVLVEKKNINEVVELLKQDEVVAFPTETVFGLGVKFGNLSALEKIPNCDKLSQVINPAIMMKKNGKS